MGSEFWFIDGDSPLWYNRSDYWKTDQLYLQWFFFTFTVPLSVTIMSGAKSNIPITSTYFLCYLFYYTLETGPQGYTQQWSALLGVSSIKPRRVGTVRIILLFSNQIVWYMNRYGSSIGPTRDRQLNVPSEGRNSLMVYLHNTKWTMGESGCVNLTYRCSHLISGILIPSKNPS